MIRRLVITLSVPAVALLTALSAAAPASAGSGAGCSGSTCSVDLSQFITLKGDVGSGAGYVPVNVDPPPCLWNPIGDATSGSNAIISEWGPNPPTDFQIDKSYAQAKTLVKAPVPGTWYELPVNPNASAAGKALCWTMPLYAWVLPGQAPPMPPIPGQTLAEFAYNNMAIPTPALTINPTNVGYVNLGTYVWQAQGSPGTLAVTASVGAQSATVTAKSSGLTIGTSGPGTPANNCGPSGSGYPVGKPPANAGAGTRPDCGVLWNGSASGATITGTVTWTVTWTATDGTGGTLPPITMRGQAGPIPINEIQSVNGG
jgi:hypothetical protein